MSGAQLHADDESPAAYQADPELELPLWSADCSRDATVIAEAILMHAREVRALRKSVDLSLDRIAAGQLPEVVAAIRGVEGSFDALLRNGVTTYPENG